MALPNSTYKLIIIHELNTQQINDSHKLLLSADAGWVLISTFGFFTRNGKDPRELEEIKVKLNKRRWRVVRRSNCWY